MKTFFLLLATVTMALAARIRVRAPSDCFTGVNGLKLRGLMNENFRGARVWSDCQDECTGNGSNMTCTFCTNVPTGHSLLADDAITGVLEGKDILSCDTKGFSATTL